MITGFTMSRDAQNDGSEWNAGLVGNYVLNLYYIKRFANYYPPLNGLSYFGKVLSTAGKLYSE